VGKELRGVSEEGLYCVVEAAEVGVWCAGHFPFFGGVEAVVCIRMRSSCAQLNEWVETGEVESEGCRKLCVHD
jgi:hypothetical protein